MVHLSFFDMFHTVTSFAVNSARAAWQLLDPKSITRSLPADEVAAGRSLVPDYSPIHALLIGIDKYKSDDPEGLRGAVADADAMGFYLRKDLRVPDDQITDLRNADATRAAIIRCIQAFRTRTTLREGDPILIYFAGHGAAVRAVSDPEASSKGVSVILPYDAVTMDDRGKRILRGISSRTLDALLYDLAGQENDGGKGDNITIIFDCCNTRFEDELDEPADEPSPAILNHAAWINLPDGRHSIPRKAGFGKPAPVPYVLLAASQDGQPAFETDNRGWFTEALLKTLRQSRPYIDTMTYQDLIHSITETPHQSPLCVGRNSDRLLFDTRTLDIRRRAYRITHKNEHARHVMEAGSIHGVTDNTQFSVYTHDNLITGGPHTAVMEVESVDAFHTVLKPCLAPVSGLSVMSSSSRFLASQISGGHALRIHGLGTSAAVRRVVLGAVAKADCAVFLCENATYADLGVRERDDSLEYILCDPMIKRYGLLHLCGTSTSTDELHIVAVLRAASHFFWRLHLAPSASTLRAHISVEFHRVKKDGGADGNVHRTSYARDGEDLCRSGVVEIVAGDDTCYGVTVRNHLDVSLHVWAFYFDCSDLSITECCRPPSWGVRGAPSLPADGSQSIGHGPTETMPFTAQLPPHQETDVGFLKFFVSTRPIDLSDVEQHSPFVARNARTLRQVARPPPVALWDTIIITVVQRRSSTGASL
ncbi:hypothetical protein PENSPDRAFT_648260 [Peniophora sp. CONT]|nr:hypothetical protein PENSPDRAFT_648260 [Peniophora sp. CONT]